MFRVGFLPFFVTFLSLITSIGSAQETGLTRSRYSTQLYAITSAQQDVLRKRGWNFRPVEDYGAFQAVELRDEDVKELRLLGITVQSLERYHLSTGSGFAWDTRTGESPIPRILRGQYGNPGFYIIQFYGPTRNEWFDELERMGVSLVRSAYFPNFGTLYYVADPSILQKIEQLPFVNWTGVYHPAYKTVRGRNGKPALSARTGLLDLRIKVLNEKAANRILQTLRSRNSLVLGYNKSEHYLFSPQLIVRAPAKDVDWILRLSEVWWVEEIVPMQPLSRVARELHQTGTADGCSGTNAETPVWNAGITGAGASPSCALTAGTEQLVGIIDTTFNNPDFECGSGIPNCTIRKYIEYNSDTGCNINNSISSCVSGHPHGSGSAGVILGNGGQSGGESPASVCSDKGGAFGARLWATRCQGASNSLSCLNNCFGGDSSVALSQFFQASYADGSRLSNHSWGASVSGVYDSSSEMVDIWAYDNDNNAANGVTQEYVWFFAAGNDGSGASTIGSPATAKNDVTGAAVYNGVDGSCWPGDSAPCDENKLVIYSSRGPTSDGRYGPEVAGASQYVTAPNNGTGYQEFNGTSCGTPSVTALGALIRNWLQQVHGIPNPSGNLVKALLLNSGESLTSPSETLPATGQGWGRPNLMNVCDNWATTTCASNRSRWQEGAFISTGQSDTTFVFNVQSASKPLHCMLTWMDPPNLAGGGALRNNLNLKVTGPGGTFYLGNDFTGAWSDANGVTSDSVNNSEGVRVQSPAVGTWIAEVTAANITQSPQPWAVVCGGDVSNPCQGNLVLDRSSYSCNSTMNITLVDGDLAGAGTQDGTVRSTTEASPETVTLTENPANSGRFTGTFQATSSAPMSGDGMISVNHGDTITVRYIDASYCGTPNVTVEQAASVDCNGPVISNVQAINVTGNSADITWNTNENADSYVVYDTVSPPSASNASGATLVTAHTVALTGLSPCTTYYFYVRSTDSSGNSTTDTNAGAYTSFTTGVNVNPTFNSTDTPVLIPDNDPAGASSTINVPDNKTIQDVNVRLSITHTFDGDLTLYLIGPDSTQITLSALHGGSGDNYTNTVFDDEAAAGVASGAPPFTGSFKPDQALTAFDGKSATGIWKMKVVDSAGVDTGTIDSWSLILMYPPQPCGPSLEYESYTVTETCIGAGSGGGNGAVEPGEDVVLALTARNGGIAGTTGVSATLFTSTLGVTVTDNTAAFPDLAVGASGASIAPHFAFTAGSGIPCGTSIQFTINFTSNEGAWSVPFTAPVGTNSSSTGSYTSSDIPKAIPDNSTIISTLTIADTGSIADVDVGLKLTHTYDADLDIYLISPGGARVELSTDNGGSDDDYSNTVFDDEAATSITAGTAPFTGSFRPEGALSALDGTAISGIWILEITDDANLDTGTLSTWSLTITRTVPVCNNCSVSAPGEASSLNWVTGSKISLTWDSTPGAGWYNLYRGTAADLPYLLDASTDSCRRWLGTGTATGNVITETPPPNSLYWFLIRAENAGGEGSPGNHSSGTRIQDSSGICP